MKEQKVVSVSLSESVANRLEKLARATSLSNSFLIVQAIEEFLTRQEWQIAAIQEGIDTADRGEVVSHDDAVAELDRWNQKNVD